MIEPMSAANLCNILVAAGATSATAEVALRMTAPARHAARVRDAMRAALEYAAPGVEPGTVDRMIKAVQDGKRGVDLPRPNSLLAGDCWALAAAAYCAAEAWVGQGGPAGAGGPGRGTARAPWAQELGKGRAHASDGPAWNGALDEASRLLIQAAGGLGGSITLEPTGEGLRAGTPSAPDVSVLLDFDSPKQAFALCVRGLASALPLEAPCRISRLSPECILRFEGSLDEWLRTLDHIGLMGVDASIREGDSPLFAPWADRAVDARLEALRRDASEATSA
jgi:hypothetical protein